MSSYAHENGANAVGGTVVSEAEVRKNYGLNAAQYILTLIIRAPERGKVLGGLLKCESLVTKEGPVLLARHTHDAGDLLAGIYDNVSATDQVDSYYFVHTDGEVTVFEDDMIRDRELEDAGQYSELHELHLQKPLDFLEHSEMGEERDLRHLTKILHEAMTSS
jgi:hypothetical protein